MAKAKEDDTGELSFEEAIKQLTEIVSGIESGRASLQDSLGQYERGMALIKRCKEILTAAEKRIEKISTSAQNESKDTDSKPAADEKDRPEDDENDESGELF